MIAACGQMKAVSIDHASEVWPVVDRVAEKASARDADLLVLPETTYPAYWLDSAERYMRDDIERTPAVLDRFSRVAAAHKFWLVAGFVEERDDRLYNGAAVFDRAGRLAGIARKNFLWDCDNRWFSPGDALSVFDSEFGPMGVLICADGRTPEITATLVNKGATLIVQPTAWVNAFPFTPEFHNPQSEFMIRARALEFSVPFCCASKSGREDRNLEYVGESQIIDARGRVMARAPREGDAVVVAEIAPAPGRPSNPDPVQREQLRATPKTPTNSAAECVIHVTSSADRIETAVSRAGGNPARLPAADLASFIPARCRALAGARVLIAEGDSGADRETTEHFARTRAAENRVFVIWVTDRVERIIAPTDRVLYRRTDAGASVTIDLREADNKCVTPETHIWRQRRVACYEFNPIAHQDS